jgi:hypothetical protein
MTRAISPVRTARNMIGAVTYLIAIAQGARLSKIASALSRVQRELVVTVGAAEGGNRTKHNNPPAQLSDEKKKVENHG